jgi:hypothetical protein
MWFPSGSVIISVFTLSPDDLCPVSMPSLELRYVIVDVAYSKRDGARTRT